MKAHPSRIDVPWAHYLIDKPETLEDLQRRFSPLGLYEER